MSKGNGKAGQPANPMEWPPLKKGEDFFAVDHGGYKHNCFRAFINEVPLEYVLKKPAYWAIVSNRGQDLREWDRIIAINTTGDDRYWAEILVVSGDPLQLQLLRSVKLDPVQRATAPLMPEGYDVVRIPETGEFQGVRLRDGHPITARRPKWDDAATELKNHAIFRQ